MCRRSFVRALQKIAYRTETPDEGARSRVRDNGPKADLSYFLDKRDGAFRIVHTNVIGDRIEIVGEALRVEHPHAADDLRGRCARRVRQTCAPKGVVVLGESARPEVGLCLGDLCRDVTPLRVGKIDEGIL